VRVDTKLEGQIRTEIGKATSDAAQSVYTEIQSGGEFLLVNIIPKATASAGAIKDALARARQIIEPAVPPRVGLHSWMILVTKERGKSAVEAAEYSEILPGERTNRNRLIKRRSRVFSDQKAFRHSILARAGTWAYPYRHFSVSGLRLFVSRRYAPAKKGNVILRKPSR
jgi:hypothetical protein